MSDFREKWKPLSSALMIIGGSALLIALEIIEEPELSWGDILLELIQPALIVITAVGVMHLLEQLKRQHQEQMMLIRELEIARAEGEQWRNDMRELIKGLGQAIDAQFDRWQLTGAEREVALLMLKGLSHKEIALIREASERTVRQQARSIYSKAKLSGRAALSAFFLEDLLLPSRQQN
jgi:DNA-binding CsgD family transcriptional regulator